MWIFASSWLGLAALYACLATRAAVAAPAGKGGEEMHAGHQLTGANFKEKIADGIWSVFAADLA